MTTGTLGIADLLAARFPIYNGTIPVDVIAEVLRQDLANYNLYMNDMISELCEITTDRERLYGGTNNANMTEVDEMGDAPGQKQVTGAKVAFPLKLFQYNTGWTERWMANATVADVAQKQIAAEQAYAKQVMLQIKQAIFGVGAGTWIATSNYTFVDRLVDRVSLAVKHFINADSEPIPDGPYGEVFAVASHQHYTAATPMVVANLTGLTTLVREHGHTDHTILAINTAQEAAVRGFTGFEAYTSIFMTLNQADSVLMQKYDDRKMDNMAIGRLGGAEVWLKPWVPSGFQFCYDAADSRKPLAFRQAVAAPVQGLRVVSRWSSHPFGGEDMEAMFGVGVLTRTNGAANYIGAAWASPSY